MGFYTPTEEQKNQAQNVFDEANLTIGRFICAWSRIEMALRSLELMHVGNHSFRPISDLHSIELKKSMRFAERVKLVVPKQIDGEQFEIYDWLIEGNKLRNLILHGYMILRRTGQGPGHIGVPSIVHSDLVATAAARKGFPDVWESHAPIYKHSMSPDTIVEVEKLNRIIDEAKDVEKMLIRVIDTTHEKGFFEG